MSAKRPTRPAPKDCTDGRVLRERDHPTWTLDRALEELMGFVREASRSTDRRIGELEEEIALLRRDVHRRFALAAGIPDDDDLDHELERADRLR